MLATYLPFYKEKRWESMFIINKMRIKVTSTFNLTLPNSVFFDTPPLDKFYGGGREVEVGKTVH